VEAAAYAGAKVGLGTEAGTGPRTVTGTGNKVEEMPEVPQDHKKRKKKRRKEKKRRQKGRRRKKKTKKKMNNLLTNHSNLLA